MKAAETSASSAIALWTELTVVSRSLTTAAIDTFMSDVSTTRTNIAAASTSDRRELPDVCITSASLPAPPGPPKGALTTFAWCRHPARWCRTWPSRSACRFLLDRALRGRDDLEPRVGDRLAALDREPVRARGESLLGTLERRQLLLEVLGAAGVELVLVEGL